jgi:tetratricopeptide (TPR) repeat protein
MHSSIRRSRPGKKAPPAGSDSESPETEAESSTLAASKSFIGRLVSRVGDVILIGIRTWRILFDPQHRSVVFRLLRRKLHRRSSPIFVWLDASLVKMANRRVTLVGSGLFLALALLAIGLAIPRKSTVSLSADEELALMMEDTANLLATRQLDLAEKNVKQLESTDSNPSAVMNFSGAIKSLRGDLAGAKKDYQRALEGSPGNFNATFNLVEVDFVGGDYRTAGEGFQAMLAAGFEKDVVHFRIFLCELLQGHDDLAAIEQQTLPQGGATAAYYYAEAARLYRLGKKSEARELVKTAQMLYPQQTNFFDATFELLGFR